MRNTDARFELYFDGDCPLCRREIALVRRMDRRNKVKFIDIADPGFDVHATGKTQQQLMDEIHGRRSDGSWVTGVDAFRDLYSAIGWWPLVWPTRLPIISHALDLGYRWFAKRRLWLTGRCGDMCADACHVSANPDRSTAPNASAADETRLSGSPS